MTGVSTNVRRLLAHYERIAEAPNAITRLRSFILDLAVRGKLVLQEAKDEPAFELLKRVAKEKTRLVAEGEIRERPALPAVAVDEMPFALPAAWLWVRFSNVVDFSAGRTPSRNDPSFWNNGDHAWVSIADMKDGQTLTATKETVSDKARERVFGSDPEPPGTVIMSFKLTIGKIARLGIPAFHNEAIISIRPHLEDLDPYLFKVIPQFARQGATRGAIKGATLNRDSISNILLPLPPLAEQHRIVAKVEELMALCDRLEEARAAREATRDRLAAASIARLNEPDTETFQTDARFALDALPQLTVRPDEIKLLRQAILNLAVRGKFVPQDPTDEPVQVFLDRIGAGKDVGSGDLKVPAGWKSILLSEIISSMTNGIYKHARFYSSTGTTCVRMYNIQDGELDLSKTHHLDLTNSEIERYQLEPGDLLVNRVNSRDLVGKAAIVRNHEETLVFEAMNIRVRFCEKKNIPEFINLVFRTSAARALFQGRAKQAVGQASISQPQIAGMRVVLPPLAEQHRIVAKVDELMVLCDQLEFSLAAADVTRSRLLETLLHEALAPTARAVGAAAE